MRKALVSIQTDIKPRRHSLHGRRQPSQAAWQAASGELTLVFTRQLHCGVPQVLDCKILEQR